MRSQTLDSASVIVSRFTALYLAPIASWSKSGSLSCQTFNVSTTIEALADLHASMNDVARAIESEESPLGDDWISRSFTWPLRVETPCEVRATSRPRVLHPQLHLRPPYDARHRLSGW